MSYKPNTYSMTVKGLFHKMNMIKLVSENIANASTVAYKRQFPESLSFKSVLSTAALKDYSQGALKKTDNPFDIGIEGNASFLIQTDKGVIPTRNGKFRLDEKGELVTQDGDEVVITEKTDEKISLAADEVFIDSTGAIFVGDEKYGRLAMQVLDNSPTRIHQGHIEESNVDLMGEMISLNMAFRTLEASEKVLGMELGVDRDLIEKYGRNV